MNRSRILVAWVLVVSAVAAQPSVIDQNQPSAPTLMANFSQTNLAQSFTPTASYCDGAGIMLGTAGTAGPVTISLWSALPNAGGFLLKSGQAMGTPGNWVDVSWPAVPVVPNQTYFLVFLATGSGMGVMGDTADPYPGGQVYANSGYGPFPSFDYTFRTYAPSFWLTVTSDGIGGGSIALNGMPVGTAEGWTLITADTSTAPGQGPIFGITPDALTYSIPTTFPFASVGNPLHWLTLVPGVFPNAPFTIPPGTLTPFLGQSWDFVCVTFDAGLFFTGQSAVKRINW